MAIITRVILPEEDGATVRHVLRAGLHFSSHAVSRLAHGGECIFVNGVPVHTPHVLRAGDLLAVETEDRRPPRTAVTPGPWPLPVVWEDGHLLIVNKPAGMTAHASNFLPDTPTVAGALAWERGADFIFHPVNRLDKGTTGLMAVAKSGYVHDLLRRPFAQDLFKLLPRPADVFRAAEHGQKLFYAPVPHPWKAVEPEAVNFFFHIYQSSGLSKAR